MMNQTNTSHTCDDWVFHRQNQGGISLNEQVSVLVWVEWSGGREVEEGDREQTESEKKWCRGIEVKMNGDGEEYGGNTGEVESKAGRD